MNEMRHVLTSLKTPTKSSSLSSATWYDVPTPIIVHCREFREEAGCDAKNDVARNRERPHEDETGNRRFVEGNAIETTILDREPSLERDPLRVLSFWPANVGCSEKDLATSNRGELSPEGSSDSKEQLYRNSRAKAEVEAETETVDGSTRVHVSLDSLEVNRQVNGERTRDGKRRATTMELNATTTVKTDADGVPTISFSFLRAEENFHENDDEIVILEVDTSDRADSSGHQSYDLPKITVLENNRVSLERAGNEINNTEINSNEFSLPAVRQDVYDVPRSTRKDGSWNESREEVMAIRILERKDQCGRMNTLGSRSLRSGRRSYGTSDSDGYDAGIASMSGSYSDPEACPNEEAALSESGGSDRGKRQLRLQKQQLGKAWGRMRSWLRDERTRIGQVVNKHAKLQAVGALTPEVGCRRKRKRDTARRKILARRTLS